MDEKEFTLGYPSEGVRINSSLLKQKWKNKFEDKLDFNNEYFTDFLSDVVQYSIDSERNDFDVIKDIKIFESGIGNELILALRKVIEINKSWGNNRLISISHETLTKRNSKNVNEVIDYRIGMYLKFKDLDDEIGTFSLELDEDAVDMLMDVLVAHNERIDQLSKI